MRLPHAIFAAMLFLLPWFAQAHVHLKKSVPAADSVVAAPQHIVLEFSGAIRLTALTLEKEGGKGAVKLAAPAAAEKSVHVAAPKLEPGAYLLNWRGMGGDNHVMSGTVRFTVAD